MGTPVEYANILYAGNTLSILSACFHKTRERTEVQMPNGSRHSADTDEEHSESAGVYVRSR